jgi:hypothetical protein
MKHTLCKVLVMSYSQGVPRLKKGWAPLLLANGLWSWSQQMYINSIIIALAIKSQAVNL